MASYDWDALSKEAEKENAIAPVGDYVAEVTVAKATTAQSGKDMLKVKFEISAGPEKGTPVWTNIVLTPDKPGFFFRNMEGLGVAQDFLRKNNPSFEDLAELIKGRTANITVAHREWQGRKQAEVKTITAVAGQAAPSTSVQAQAPAANGAAAPAQEQASASLPF